MVGYEFKHNRVLLSGGCLLLGVIGLTLFRSSSTAANMSLYAVDFEVFGQVQQVFFRKYTQEQAKSLGIKGWCKNTPQGTVQGQAEGPKDKLEEMKQWLKNTGSPQSRIDHTEFKNERNIDKYSFTDFDIIRRQK